MIVVVVTLSVVTLADATEIVVVRPDAAPGIKVTDAVPVIANALMVPLMVMVSATVFVTVAL